jgi:uncharacterized membrane protein (DUF106 family)
MEMSATPTISPIPDSAVSYFASNPASALLVIMVIAVGIAFLNTAVNRLLISHFIGWSQYRTMQKEMNEHRQDMMAAMRSNDKKQIEKLKKKDSQIKAMQAKMFKPQMVQIAVSFLYIFVWIFVLTPTFKDIPVAYLPGLGTVANAHLPGIAGAVPNALTTLYWYPVCSFPFGFLASRILGVMPIEW